MGSETVSDQDLLTLLLASQMSNRAIDGAPIPLRVKPSQGKNWPRGHSWAPSSICSTCSLRGCLRPREQDTLPHPSIPREGNGCGSPQSDFCALSLLGCNHTVVVINEELPSP